MYTIPSYTQLAAQPVEILGFDIKIGIVRLLKTFSHVVLFRNVDIRRMQSGGPGRRKIPFVSSDHHGLRRLQPQ